MEQWELDMFLRRLRKGEIFAPLESIGDIRDAEEEKEEVRE